MVFPQPDGPSRLTSSPWPSDEVEPLEGDVGPKVLRTPAEREALHRRVISCRVTRWRIGGRAAHARLPGDDE